MDIRKKIKKIMADKGLTYREIGKRCGWSAQNVWIKLNTVEPNYETVITILHAMGLAVKITEVEHPVKLLPEQRALMIEDLAKDQQVSFELVEQLAKSLGYEVDICEPDDNA